MTNGATHRKPMIGPFRPAPLSTEMAPISVRPVTQVTSMPMSLRRLVQRKATALKAADSRKPMNSHSRPGIGIAGLLTISSAPMPLSTAEVPKM